jgi:glycosyltransferase involved in cell wall biosynthesis
MIGTGVTSIPPKRGGGVERVTFNISKGLSKLDHEITIIDIKGGKKEIGGIKFERISAPKIRGLGKLSLVLTELFFGFLAILKARKLRKKVDIFHVHTSICGFIFCFFKELLDKPVVYTSYNPDWSLPVSELPTTSRLMLKIESFCIKWADVVIATSDATRKGMSKIRGGISVIHNFVDDELFSPKYGHEFKRKLGIEGPMILFVGKLTRAKGVEYLLKAAKEVVEKKPEAKFVLVGPVSFLEEGKNPWDKLRSELGLEKNVVFTGGVSFKELLEAYSSADIFVLPSLKEAFSTVILEAMSFKLPIVASRIPGISEAVSPENGILVDKGNVKQLSNAILRLLENKDERLKMGEKSRKKIIREFTIEHAAKLHLEAYEKALSVTSKP